jgi:hypothetical protein
MSDLLNSASLVLIPSGYKEDTVYSVVPSDGSGDLSFTRASNGTRVNSAGLVEVTPWNLLQQSEALNTTWSDFGTGVTVTANATTAPNGTSTADKLEFPTSTGSAQYVLGQIVNVEVGVPYTFSFWAKAVSGTITNLVVRINGAEAVLGETITTEWQRFTKTLTPTTASDDTGFKNRSDVSGSGTAINVYIWGAQLNIGSTAKPYFPTTDRLNVPRLTYQNGGGGCPSLLLEKQSTNYVTYSEDFTTNWSLTNTIATENQTTSPDGTQNADKIDNGSATGQHRYFQSVLSGLTNQTLSFSIYAKQGTHRYISWGITDDTDYRGQVVVDLQTGTITDQFTASATLSNLSVVSQGNGWYKISGTIAVSANWAGGNAYAFGLMLETSSWSTGAYAGTNTYFYAWGAQVEQSSYPTSYIPTTSASATRVADACFKTGISSLIGQTEGTMFVDVDFTQNTSGSNAYLMQIRENSNNRILLYRDSSNNGIGIVALKAGGVILGNASSVSTNTRHKIAIAYKSGDLAFYIDGVQIATSSNTFSAYSSLDELDLGCNNTSGTPVELGDYEYNEALLFKTRLTNAELASLTTI